LNPTKILLSFVASSAVTVAAVPLALADVHLTVNAAGGAQFTTVQAAVDSVPTTPAERYVIHVAPGVYTEQLRVNKPMVTLRGAGATAGATKITFNQTAQPGNPLANASTAIQSRDFYAENLTFENSVGDNAGVGLAMYVKADRAVFNNVRFLGWQDTLRSETGRHYFLNCYVEGDVDFIYGKGQAYFENATIFAKSGGYVTAQGREGSAETNGFVFYRATVTGSAPNDSVYLGRPWQAYSRSVFIESTLGDLVNPAGWSAWSGNSNHLTSYFAESGNTGPGAAGTRPAWTYRLTADQLAPFSRQAWLGGTDNWQPTSVIPEPGAASIVAAWSIGLLRRWR
jgi:pectinesterase